MHSDLQTNKPKIKQKNVWKAGSTMSVWSKKLHIMIDFYKPYLSTMWVWSKDSPSIAVHSGHLNFFRGVT